MTALLESSVVRFYSKSGAVIGAGFLVSQKHILTCAHVVADALEIERETAEMPDEEVNLDFPILAPQQILKARVVFWRPVNPNEFEEDIAGLELESSPPDTAQPAQLLTSEDLWGHSFRVLGFPEGQPNGASASGELRGRLANGWVQLEDVKQPGYRLEPGFSGAPVWDEQLQGVVGIAVAAEMNRPEVKAAFIIPTNLLLSAWTFLGEQAIPACPYRGLFAFQEKDAPFFFGRETFTEQLLAAVQKKPLVAVIGPSGSGKSSVVFAGLIPRLQQVGAQDLAPLHIASFRPGDRPFRNLARQLVPLLETQMSEIDQLVEVNKLATALQQGNLALQDVVTRIQEKNSGDRLLLVADQFEELYTLCQDVQERQVFLARLLAVVNHTRNFNLVLTLRADFLGYALSYRPFADALQNADVKLGPMNRKELQDAVQKPAEKQGVKLEQGLTERILEAVGEEPGNLPSLEFALTQLWEKQSNGKLTHAAYDAIGGVEKALSNHADDVYGSLTDEEQKQVQKIFIQLVRPGEGTADTRRQAIRAEIGEENWDLVQRLADERLVVSDRKKTTGEAEEETVEIVHEALIREWSRLRQWMKDDRAFRLWQERLRAVMHQWETNSEDEGALLRGAALAEAEAWQQKHLDKLSHAERVFIQLSLALRDKEKQQKERQRLRLRLLLTTGLVIALTLASLVGWQWRQSEGLRSIANDELARRHAADELNAVKEKIARVSLIRQTKGFAVQSLFVTEDAVWITVYDGEEQGRGLMRYDLNKNTIQSYLQGNKVTAILVEKNDIWVGVANQGVRHGIFRNGRWAFTDELLTVPRYITSLVRDQQNRLWVGTSNGVCLKTSQQCQFVNPILSVCPPLGNPPVNMQVSQMRLDTRRNALWIATNKGLARWQLDGKQERSGCYWDRNNQQGQSEPLPDFMTAIALDQSGHSWIATSDGDVKRFSQGIDTPDKKDDVWDTHHVTSRELEVLAALPNDLLLLATKEPNLILYNTTTKTNFDFFITEASVKKIYNIVLDHDNYLWLATNQGLVRSEQPIQPYKNYK